MHPGCPSRPPRSSGTIPEPKSTRCRRLIPRLAGRCPSNSALRRSVVSPSSSSSTPRSMDSRRRRRPASPWKASRGSARRTCSPPCVATPRSRGFLVLVGSATEFERDLPFSVWIDALDAYVASQELDLDETWSAELVDELAEIIPSVRRRGDGSRTAVADERYRAHRAVRRLLELLAVAQPLVVVLDDLHWGDEASIELLAALLRREADAPVLLALALPSWTGSCAPFGGTLGAIGPKGHPRAAERGPGDAAAR